MVFFFLKFNLYGKYKAHKKRSLAQRQKTLETHSLINTLYLQEVTETSQKTIW